MDDMLKEQKKLSMPYKKNMIKRSHSTSTQKFQRDKLTDTYFLYTSTVNCANSSKNSLTNSMLKVLRATFKTSCIVETSIAIKSKV